MSCTRPATWRTAESCERSRRWCGDLTARSPTGCSFTFRSDRHSDVSRPLRIAGYIALGIATGLLLATLAIILLTRTEWGQERSRRFAVAWLADRIHGELRIDRITSR